jgi:hypothetical protein
MIEVLMKKNVFLSTIVLVTILLCLLVPGIRVFSGKQMAAGTEAYHDMNIVNQIIEYHSIEDNFVFGRIFWVTPYIIILSILMIFLSNGASLLILQLVTIIGSVVLLYLLLDRFTQRNSTSLLTGGMSSAQKPSLKSWWNSECQKPPCLYQRKIMPPICEGWFLTKDDKTKLLFFTILFLSPSFIYLASRFTGIGFAILFLLLGFYFLLRSKRFFALAVFCLVIAAISNLIQLVIILILLLMIEQNNNLKDRYALKTLPWIIFFAGLYYIIFLSISHWDIRFIIENGSIKNIFTDFGSNIGISVFALILGFIGLIKSWALKDKIKDIYLLFLILFIISFYNELASIYLNFIVICFGVYALKDLFYKEWALPSIKSYAFLIIISGLLFSAIAYTQRSINELPSEEIVGALRWIGSNTEKEDIIFSYYTKGVWINHFADRKTIADNFFIYPNARTILADSSEILYSRKLELTKGLLDKYKISYIFIDKNMKEGEVWKKQSGLWYLLGNNETFKHVYSNSDADIWEYKLLNMSNEQ